MNELIDYATSIMPLVVIFIIASVVLAKTARNILRDLRDSTSSPMGFLMWLLIYLVIAPILALGQVAALFPYACIWVGPFICVFVLTSFLGAFGMWVQGIYGVVSAVFLLIAYWMDLADSGGAFASAGSSYNSDPSTASSSNFYNPDPYTTAQNTVNIPSQIESPSYGYESGGSNSATPNSGFGSTYGPSPGHPGGDQATTNYN